MSQQSKQQQQQAQSHRLLRYLHIGNSHRTNRPVPTDTPEAISPAVQPDTMASQSLKGKVAIVTGAGKPNGIGAASAIAFAEQGANVGSLLRVCMSRPADTSSRSLFSTTALPDLRRRLSPSSRVLEYKLLPFKPTLGQPTLVKCLSTRH